ncbi:Gfo/Idh/MocA family oxidoreductase [Saccharopolyspora sp. K220]|uniref:Gfo/Idh/MocA family protein n=1 Tax=Saccharopolyspora soli TaxID=2926618 RepID=UPI001F55B173|nr:Gfo/Idh/MocA family oxidoreductase [Saccharopolyspora soli]MCI2424199.1 Gfo/Idh/MocA family oxidoreductase [Saccharopolyspora soli]
MIGYAFMGRVHSHAWRSAGRFFELPLDVRMSVLCGRDAQAAGAAAETLGWSSVETDWRRVVDSDEVQLVDICTPGASHAEIAIAALAAGKHVLCEKPLGNTVEEAREMVLAARQAAQTGVLAMVGFNYRRLPAATFARRLVEQGRIGTVRHVRAQYLQDFVADPAFPLVWRLRRDQAGSGALGDIGSHIVDLAQFITGETISSVSGTTETFVRNRPLPDGSGEGEVTVDDAAVFLARMSGGGLATFEATRFATGRKNALRIEINGSRGSLAFDLERLNELEFHDATEDSATAGFRRILVTEPEHPYLEGWWPPGHGLGYEHSFTHEIKDLVEALAAGAQPRPSFVDGLRVQLVLDAVERSARADGRWVSIPDDDDEL